MNYETRVITKDEYINIIKTLREGYLNHRPNPKVAMALVMEANIGIRISDITQFSLDMVIKEIYYTSRSNAIYTTILY